MSSNEQFIIPNFLFHYRWAMTHHKAWITKYLPMYCYMTGCHRMIFLLTIKHYSLSPIQVRGMHFKVFVCSSSNIHNQIDTIKDWKQTQIEFFRQEANPVGTVCMLNQSWTNQICSGLKPILNVSWTNLTSCFDQTSFLLECVGDYPNSIFLNTIPLVQDWFLSVHSHPFRFPFTWSDPE